MLHLESGIAGWDYVSKLPLIHSKSMESIGLSKNTLEMSGFLIYNDFKPKDDILYRTHLTLITFNRRDPKDLLELRGPLELGECL